MELFSAWKLKPELLASPLVTPIMPRFTEFRLWLMRGRFLKPAALGNAWDASGTRHSSGYAYLEGQGDLVSRIIMGIIGDTTWRIGVISILTKSP